MLPPSLGSARILSKKLSSVRAIFQKARIEKIGKNEPIWYYYLGKERFGFEFEFSRHKSIFNIIICTCFCLSCLVALTFYIWPFRGQMTIVTLTQAALLLLVGICSTSSGRRNYIEKQYRGRALHISKNLLFSASSWLSVVVSILAS